MIAQNSIEHTIPQFKSVVPRGYLDPLVDFTAGVGGVQHGDTVAEVSACQGLLSDKLRRMGANVIRTDWWSLNGNASCRLQPGRIDIAFAVMVLHLVRFPSVTISELRKAIRPGGRLVVADLARINDFPINRERFDPQVGFYPGDIRHWLKTAGFSNIIVNPVPFQLIGPAQSSVEPPAQIQILMATGTAY